jgi:hypothetical protein
VVLYRGGFTVYDDIRKCLDEICIFDEYLQASKAYENLDLMRYEQVSCTLDKSIRTVSLIIKSVSGAVPWWFYTPL